jgi:hypothetical protein
MRAFLVTLACLLIWGIAGYLIYAVPDFRTRLVVSTLAIFLVDALGGRWFGFASLGLILVGLLRDPRFVWSGFSPILLACGYAALLFRHAEPGWLGLPLTMAGFFAPLGVFVLLRSRIDPSFTPPFNNYLLFHGLTGLGALLLAFGLQLWLGYRPKPKPTPLPKGAGKLAQVAGNTSVGNAVGNTTAGNIGNVGNTTASKNTSKNTP